MHSELIARLEAAGILDVYGFELQSMPMAMRSRLAFENGAKIIISSRAGSMLPTLDDWQIMAFFPDGTSAYEAIGHQLSALRFREAIEAARERVDPTLEPLCEAR